MPVRATLARSGAGTVYLFPIIDMWLQALAISLLLGTQIYNLPSLWLAVAWNWRDEECSYKYYIASRLP